MMEYGVVQWIGMVGPHVCVLSEDHCLCLTQGLTADFQLCCISC